MHNADEEMIKILNTKNERPGRQLLRYNTQNMKISYLCRIAMNYTHFRCIQIFCNLLSGLKKKTVIHLSCFIMSFLISLFNFFTILSFTGKLPCSELVIKVKMPAAEMSMAKMLRAKVPRINFSFPWNIFSKVFSVTMGRL